MGEEFLLDIIALLNQQLSKKKIKEQLKGMDNSMYVKVISKLSMALSQRQLKKDLKQLNDLYLQVGADLKIDSVLKKKLQGRIKTLQDSISDLQIGVRAKDSDIAKTVTEARNKGQRVANRTSIGFNIEVKKEKAIADLEYMAKKYSKLFSNASASSKYNNILDAAYGITDAKQLSNVRAQIAAFTSELKANNLASQSLGDKWRSLISRCKDMFSAASAATMIFSQVRQAVSSFLQLDTAMTNLYKVQDQITSRDQFSRLLTKWNNLAQNLAVTTESLISSMEAWSKIGFNLDMSEQLAEITSIFEKTAEISNEKATSTLISAAQAFTEIDDLGVDDYVKRVEAVGNKINAIGNKYAIDSEGIADGLQNASAALKVAGNDLNETIALITTTNKIYQNPEEGSNMLKVASMRLRGQVDALKSMGEDVEGVSTDLTKIQQQVYKLTGNKVNIFEDDENLKSTYQMILEIGEVFDSLSDRSQADLLEVMFGKQRASAGASLLLNYEELEKIKNDSMDAANSMAEEYSKYMESAEASLTTFKEKLIETYSTFMSGDLIKYTADMGSGLLDLVNATDILRHGLVGIVSLNIGKGITSIGASIATTAKQFNMLGNALQQVKNLPTDKVLRKESLQELGEATKNLTEKNLKLILSQKQLKDSDKETILSMHDITKEEAKLKLEKMGLLSVTKSQTTANVAEAATTGTLKNAMLSLKATAKEAGMTIKGMFASNPIGMWFMVISTAFSVFSTAISKANEKLEETRRANIEAATAASQEADKLNGLYSEYTRLASIQDRTTSEEEAFKTAVENITVALGDKAEALENLTAGTDEYADALARVTKEELQSQAVTATIGRKSAEEELQGKIWSKLNGSQVSIDSNSKGKSLSDEAQKAVDIVSDSLKEFEAVNRTWKNISWDIDSDDPAKALEYYNSLVEAREKLVLASENDESLLDTETYEDLNTAINSMSESLDTYIKKLYEEEKLNYMAQNGIPSVTGEYEAMESALVSAAGSSVDLQDKFKELLMSDFSDLATAVGDTSSQIDNIKTTFDQAWADSFTSENEKVKELGNTLLELAEKGRLTVDAFNEADSTGYFKNLGISADEAVLKVNKLADESKQLSSMSNQISSMIEALSTKQGEGFVNADTLSGFDAEVRGLESWDHFQKTLGSTASSYQECEEAANALATEWVNSSDFLAQLTEQNKEYYATQLQAMGIENYEEVISYAQALNEAKEVLSQSSLGFGDATQDEIESLIAEGAYLGLTADLILALYDAKVAEQAATLDTSADCENLIALAGDTDKTSRSIQLLTHLMDIYNGLESGAYDGNRLLREEALAEVDRIKKELEGLANGEAKGSPIEPTVKLGAKGRSSAKSAGKEAADAYLESFEKELKNIDDLKDRGKITEKQYLDALRSLYLKYFRDKEKYLKEYEKYEHQYLDGMKSLYESAFSYITKQVGKRIDALNDERDAAVSALEAERDARLEAIEAQKGQLENEIEGIEKKIDAKEKEIKAMQDANEERKKAVDLQKAEYEWQRMQNQKTANVYKDGQMVYGADTSGIRDAKQQVEDARLEIDISKIEKEIGLLEDQKGLLEEQIDLLDKQADQINKYYDNLIKQTESHYDAMIKGMEDYKSQFDELTDLLEDAQMEAALSELGINMDALLSGSQEEFEKLKTAYIGILADMGRGNEGVIDQLSRLSGISTQSISYLESTKDAFDGLGDVALGGLGESIDGIGESVGALSTSAGEASSAVSGMQTDMDKATQSVAPLNTELSSLKTLITELIGLLDGIKFPEIGDEGYAQKLKDIAQAFGEVASKCNEFKNIDFSSIIGTPEPGMDGDEMPSGDGMGGAAGTGFMGLAAAINEAVTSIGEQMGNLETALDKGNSHFKKQMAVINDEYIPAWEDLQTRLAEIIGVGGGGGDNKEGKGDKGAGSKSGNTEPGGNDGSIIDIMQTGGDAVDAKLEDPWLKAFNDFATDGDNSIQTICNKIIELVSEMARIIQEKCEAAASALNALAKTASSSLHSVGGSVSGNTIPSHAEGTVGDAFANGTGYKGLPHDEKNALRSEYGQAELTVYPDGKTELTTEPVMSDLPKDTVIFNEEQTKRIMENKGKELGNAYDDGTITLAGGTEIRPLNPSDREYWLHKKFDEFFKKNKDAFLMPTNAMFKTAESVDKMVEVINNNHTMNREISVHIGDINLQGVQDVNSLSKEIVLRMPNMLLQEMHKV